MKLNERVAFDLKNLILSFDKAEFNDPKFHVDNSALKAVVMRRHIVDEFEKKTMSYKEKMDVVIKISNETIEKLKQFNEEINATTAKNEEEKRKEKEIYEKEQNALCGKKIKKAVGSSVTYYGQYAKIGTEEIVEIVLSDAQMEFLKRLFEARAVTHMLLDEDVIEVGKNFSLG